MLEFRAQTIYEYLVYFIPGAYGHYEQPRLRVEDVLILHDGRRQFQLGQDLSRYHLHPLDRPNNTIAIDFRYRMEEHFLQIIYTQHKRQSKDLTSSSSIFTE